MRNETRHHGGHGGHGGKDVQNLPSVSPVSSVVDRLFAWLGLAIMVFSETATLLHIEPFWSWNTPIAWTGFIIFADSIVYRARGDSWIRSAPREFAVLALVSIPLWLVFEWFNLYIRNWHYTGLPENVWLRQFGYAWSFATITPAIFEGADLVAVLRAGRAGQAGRLGPDGLADPAHPASHPAHPAYPALWITLGAAMLISPFLASTAVARYMAAPVWLGFIFLLDPINARLGGDSLLAEWRAGRFDRTINLALSGMLCGLLWEFWNYWAHAKWHYTVPIMQHLKIFEMPVPGYLGFPAFAFECFTMYEFLRSAFGVRGRPIGM
jgi:hypothetical protein